MMFSWKRILFIVGVLISTNHCFSQNNPNEYVEEKPVLLRKEFTFGVNLHTSGWGLEIKRGRNITGFKKLMFEAQIVSMKHSKEFKQVNPYFENSKSFVYGKLNTFTIIRASTGVRHTIYSKADRTGVEVRFNYMGGVSLGILKPVYLEIFTRDNSVSGYTTEEKYHPDKHFVDNIYGRAPFTLGLDQIKFHPGAFAKAGFNFEYAPYHEDIKAVEVGAALDAYFTKAPIMALTENKRFFLSFYITFLYGKKW